MEDDRLLGDPDARKALDELHDKGLNFDLGRRAEFTPKNGWYVDDYCQPLPPEGPGPPRSDGSWEIARRLVRDYEFADPAIIRAIHYPQPPLEQRDMLLEGRFYGLRIYMGVRVGGVNDETRAIDATRVRVWGWNYRTLQGHLEMGQMDYEVWKWLDTGSVEFRIHAFSRPATIHNPLLRVGFRLFGRRMQVKFARNCCARMKRLTEAGLKSHRAGTPTSTVPSTADRIQVAPARARRSPRGKRPHRQARRPRGDTAARNGSKGCQMISMLRTAGVHRTHAELAAVTSLVTCLGLWIRAKTIDQAEREHAEWRAVFVGLWPPVFWLLADQLKNESRAGGRISEVEG